MRRKSKKINVFKVLSIILIIIFIFITPIILQKLIKIKKVICVSQYGSCSYEFELSNYRTTKNNIEKILKKDIQINNYLIQYKIPSTLKVEINIKKPKYAVFYNQKYFLLDKEGLILSESKETNLPTLVNNNFQNKIGNMISNKELFSLKIIEKVAQLYSVKTGLIQNEELKIILKEGILVHFPLEGDIDTLVGSLRLVFSRLNDESQGIKMEDVREIDLRFKDVVLK